MPSAKCRLSNSIATPCFSQKVWATKSQSWPCSEVQAGLTILDENNDSQKQCPGSRAIRVAATEEQTWMMYRSLSNKFGGTRSAYSRKNCMWGDMAR